ncbi:hypothetical protein [Mumia zhuanghuii]|uniref:Uncharacterized protein n=1 Tax=Mumia zhuanghuii TaxID=2585211 RepID=A0A5C4LTP3_9ACTN|nr:hypothetical protein [Mumia zhuanghuii]TNC22175.1 hypothetical protein FHE65_35850 [Mumia zhuanghuii]
MQSHSCVALWLAREDLRLAVVESALGLHRELLDWVLMQLFPNSLPERAVHRRLESRPLRERRVRLRLDVELGLREWLGTLRRDRS